MSLEATITPLNLTARGLNYELVIPSLNISVKGRTPTQEACRKIIKADPSLGKKSLKVYREDGSGRNLAYTVRCIGKEAQVILCEEDKRGLRAIPFREFPSIDPLNRVSIG